MIVFGGIVPASPLLLESVNPEHVHEAKRTRTALAEMAEELFAARPDTIVLFCDHMNGETDSFSVNVADPYHASLKEFGDLGYAKTYPTDFMLADALQRSVRKSGHAISLITQTELPFTATVPLAFLTEHLPDVHILPISPSTASPKEHFEFGSALRESLISSPKRIAVIASGDGSHTRGDRAPGGNNPDGEKLDTLLATLVAQKNTAGLLTVDESLRTQVQDASYRQLVMLFGAFESTPVESRVLSEEAPFGVGALVAELRLG